MSIIENNRPIVELPSLREKLDNFAERIIIQLKDRSLLPLNEKIHQTDGITIANRRGVSLFEVAIEGLENYHALLGRYSYPGQYPILNSSLPKPIIERVIGEQPLRPANIDIKDELLSFYKGFVKKLCKPEDDPTFYGSTAHLDAQLVVLIHERANVGRYVSEAKAHKDPELYEVLNNPDKLLSKLKDIKREDNLVEKAREAARLHGLDEDLIEQLFRWMI